jgi:hypothetical protein
MLESEDSINFHLNGGTSNSTDSKQFRQIQSEIVADVAADRHSVPTICAIGTKSNLSAEE